MTPQETASVGVIGAGAWGTTLAAHLVRMGNSVLIWSYEEEVRDEINARHTNSVYHHGFDLPADLKATSNLSDFSDFSRLLIVVPSAFYTNVVRELSRHVQPHAQVVSATKGFIDNDLTRPMQFLEETLPQNPRGVLSGPNLSREISSGLPAISLIASKDAKMIQEFQSLLSTGQFRVYGGTDVAGTELGGALKNIMAIAAGIADGLSLGENTLAALITRGLAETIKIGRILGADDRTFFGVSGLGDLVCTSQSRLSRNQQVGRRIAGGETLDEILSAMAAVAEGVDTTRHVHSFGRDKDLDLPITNAVYTILFEGEDPSRALRELMTRKLKME